MSYDDETSDALRRSLEERTRRLRTVPDADELFRRIEHRRIRRQRLAVVAIVAMLFVGVSIGYVIGQVSADGSPEVSVAALDDGLPDSLTPEPSLQPTDLPAAISGIGTAFHDVYDGRSPIAARIAASQSGAALVGFWRESRHSAQRFGYTPEQLDGASIIVSDTTFIDDAHAAVHFTLSIPGHGDVLVDRTGYAIFADGRWKVSLRTACDIISLNGTTKTCPPAS